MVVVRVRARRRFEMTISARSPHARITRLVVPALPCLALGLSIAVPAFGQQPTAGTPPVPAAEEAPAPAPPSRSVRVALVNLEDAASIGAIPSSEPVRAVYRHTFGAERKTIPVTQRLDPTAWAADVVLIQGFSSLRETRKLFPARGWKLVMSRQLVDAQTTAKQADRPPATAIAVRHRLGLRIAGQELKLDPGTGTAVRVLVAGSPVWFLSVAPPTGESATVIEAWIDARHAAGEQSVIGGRLPAALPRERGAAAPFSPRGITARAPSMPALIASGERRLVDGTGKSHARFPAASPPSPCGGSPAGADAIVVDQQIGDRMKPDTGGWLVTMRKPAPPTEATGQQAAPAGPLSAAQIRAATPAQGKAAPATAPASPPKPQPAACILILDLGV